MITKHKIRRLSSWIMLPVVALYAFIPNWSLGEVVSRQSSVASGQWSVVSGQEEREISQKSEGTFQRSTQYSVLSTRTTLNTQHSTLNTSECVLRKDKQSHLLIHPSTHPRIHAFTHSPIHPFTHSPIHASTGLSILDNPFKYSGYYTDPESGMSYCQARYYSPELMTWISRDTYDVLNRYGYCKGNPVMNTDVNGHCPIVIVIISLIASLVFSGASAACATIGENTNNDVLKGFGWGFMGLSIVTGFASAGSLFSRVGAVGKIASTIARKVLPSAAKATMNAARAADTGMAGAAASRASGAADSIASESANAGTALRGSSEVAGQGSRTAAPLAESETAAARTSEAVRPNPAEGPVRGGQLEASGAAENGSRTGSAVQPDSMGSGPGVAAPSSPKPTVTVPPLTTPQKAVDTSVRMAAGAALYGADEGSQKAGVSIGNNVVAAQNPHLQEPIGAIPWGMRNP